MDISILHITAMITGLAAAIYVLGMIALCWPVYRTITKDASTALYAVALVPRTVVVGQGMRIFVGYPLVAALFLVTVLSVPLLLPAAITSIFQFFGLPSEALKTLEEIFASVIPPIAAAAITLLFIRLYEELRTMGLIDFFFPPPTEPGAPGPNIRTMILGLLGGVIGAWLLLAGGIGWESSLKALVVVFFINAIAGAPDAVSIDPPLPVVNVRLTETTNEGEPSAANGKLFKGKLLAHSEGLWYVFEDHSSKLVAIPDSKAEIEAFQVTG